MLEKSLLCIILVALGIIFIVRKWQETKEDAQSLLLLDKEVTGTFLGF